MRIFLLMPVLLVACAATPEQMVQQSNYDVCRFTMGGPHSQVADYEARRRGLDCSTMYGAIAAREGARNAATANFINAINPPPQPMRPQVNCRSYRVGNEIRTDCN